MSQHAPSPAHSGAAAETHAAEYLRCQGLELLARNLRCKAGELDLICLDRDTLVVVEVRLRSRGDFGGPLASVTPRKQRKIIRAVKFFWQRRSDWRDRRLRFDVVGVTLRVDGSRSLEWIKDAFRLTR